jgi:hypothetical protein
MSHFPRNRRPCRQQSRPLQGTAPGLADRPADPPHLGTLRDAMPVPAGKADCRVTTERAGNCEERVRSRTAMCENDIGMTRMQRNYSGQETPATRRKLATPPLAKAGLTINPGLTNQGLQEAISIIANYSDRFSSLPTLSDIRVPIFIGSAESITSPLTDWLLPLTVPIVTNTVIRSHRDSELAGVLWLREDR